MDGKGRKRGGEGEEKGRRRGRRRRGEGEKGEEKQRVGNLVHFLLKQTQTNAKNCYIETHTNKQMLRVESGLGTTPDLLLVAVESRCMSSKSPRHLEVEG